MKAAKHLEGARLRKSEFTVSQSGQHMALNLMHPSLFSPILLSLVIQFGLCGDVSSKKSSLGKTSCCTTES